MAVVVNYGNVTVRGVTYTGKGSQSATAVSSWSIANLSDPQMYNYYDSTSGYSISSVTSNKTLYLHWYATATGDTVVRNKYYVGQYAGGGFGWVREDVFPYGTNTVSYSASGGSTTPSSQTKTYGTNLTIASAISRTGYTFNGWKSSKTSTVYAAGATITDTEFTSYAWNGSSPTLTLTAQWTINSYTVTANANGGTIPATSGWTGSGNTATKSVNYNSAIGTLPTPTRTGYTFNGWFTASSGGTQVTSSTVITAATPLYAQWTLSTYTYTFDPNNGTSGASQTVTRDNGQTIIKTDGTVDGVTSPTRTGYLFQGWNTSSSATVALTGITATGTYAKNMTFYAIWKAATSSITVNDSTVTIDVSSSNAISVTVTRPQGVTGTEDAISVMFNGVALATATATYNAQDILIDGAALASLMPTATSGTLIFTTITSMDGTVIGSASAAKLFQLAGTGLTPTVSGTVTLTEMNSIISSWGLSRGYIATKSQIKIDTSSLTVTPGTGATITGIALSASNGDGAFTQSLAAGGSVTVTPVGVGSGISLRIIATDSRGRSSVQTNVATGILVLGYDRPTVAITGVTYNDDGDSSYTYTATVATYNNTTANLATETSTFYLGTSTDPAFPSMVYTGVKRGEYTRYVPEGTLQPKSTYTVTIAIKDSFYTAVASVGFTTSSGQPILDFFKDDAVKLFGYVDNDGHAVSEGLPDGFTVGGEKTTDLTGDVYVGKHTYLGLQGGAVISTGENEPLVAGVLPILYGGTGADDKVEAQQNLGLFIGDTDKPDDYFSTGAGASLSPQSNDLYAWQSNTLPVEMGGTGASDGEQALVNLGLLDPNTTVSNVPQIYPKYGGGGSGDTYTLSGTLSNHTFTNTITAGSGGSSSSAITFVAGNGVELADSGASLTITSESYVTEDSGGCPLSSYGAKLPPTTWPTTYQYTSAYSAVQSGLGWREMKHTNGRLEKWLWGWIEIDSTAASDHYWRDWPTPSGTAFVAVPNMTAQCFMTANGNGAAATIVRFDDPTYVGSTWASSGITSSYLIGLSIYDWRGVSTTNTERCMVQIYMDGRWK